MRIFAVLMLCLLSFRTVAFAVQSRISSGMDILADNLVSTYRKNHSDASDRKVAVFKFNSSAELGNKRIGFAVSELLTHRIAIKSGFTVVERIGLDKILSELKLNLSGATSPEDALTAGKLGGANLLILGSVEKIADKYHVNARLVEVETAEVVATAYESFPIKFFEEDARNYIGYTPENQRIGIYVLVNWRNNSNNLPHQEITANFHGPNRDTSIVDPRSFESLLRGVGLRYVPWEKLVIDVSRTRTGSKLKAGHVREEDAGWIIRDSDYYLTVLASRILISIKSTISTNLFAYFGAGATNYKISGFSYTTPSIQIRTEYFLQDRVGLSFSANYDFVSKPAKISGLNGYIPNGLAISKRGELNRFSIEPSISLYF